MLLIALGALVGSALVAREKMSKELTEALNKGGVIDKVSDKVETVDADNAELVSAIREEVNKDCDHKLTLIPSVVKGLLDNTEAKAELVNN